MAAFNKFESFSEYLAEGVFDFTSDATCTVTCALVNQTNGVSASADAVLTDIVEIAYTNLSSRVITGVSTSRTGGTTTLTATDLTISASGGAAAAFRYIVLYDDDPTAPADPLIGWYDYGSDLTLADGESLTLDFTTGFLTIA